MDLKLAAVLARQVAFEQDTSSRVGSTLTVTAVCRELGISRQTYYTAKRRYDAQGVTGLLPRSRRPLSSPGQTPADVEDRVVAMRKQLTEDGWDAGAVSIGYHLARAGGPVPSRATIHRILNRRGLVEAQPQKRPRSSWKSFSFARRNDCWQFDAFVTKLAAGTAVAVFQLLDDCTRFEVANLAAPAETAQAALACFLTAVAEHGVPAMLLSDNGAAFSSARHGRRGLLEQAAADLGCHTVQSSPYHPQTCGKNERAHQTCQRWLARQPLPTSLPDLQALLDRYRHAYNHDRPHQALDGRTPAEAAAAAAVATPNLPVTQPAPAVTSRKVSASGCITINNRSLPVGRKLKGRNVTVVQHGGTATIFDGRKLLREITLDIPTGSQPQPAAPATMSTMS